MHNNLRMLHMERTRAALKHAITPDTFIIHTIHTIDELDLLINKLLTLLRERYASYAPRRMKEGTLQEILHAVLTQHIDDLGISLLAADYAPLHALASEIQHLLTLKTQHEHYLETLMHAHCPRLQEKTGSIIGARLISLGGSLRHLAELPSSTIQILGAEKALFRHLKTGAKAPRFGILFAHPTITNAPEGERGKTARKLANKIAIAVKQDAFASP